MEPLNDLSPMPFGKHKGIPMQDVPASYLHFLWTEWATHGVNQCEGSKLAVGNYIRENIHALSKEYPDGEWN